MVLVAGNDGAITAHYPNIAVDVSQNLYIGSAVIPSSVSFILQGQPISDQGGLLKILKVSRLEQLIISVA